VALRPTLSSGLPFSNVLLCFEIVKELAPMTAICVPLDPEERLMVDTPGYNGISDNYEHNKIVLIRLDNEMELRGRGIAEKKRFGLQKCNKPGGADS
jgi:hypothetical protein